MKYKIYRVSPHGTSSVLNVTDCAKQGAYYKRIYDHNTGVITFIPVEPSEEG